MQISNFRDLSLVSFYFYELIHFLHRMKNTLLFIRGTNILVRLLTVNMKNCNTPPKPENVRPHYSHSSRENATPSSGTSLLASSKGVHPPPPRALGKLANPTLNNLYLICSFVTSLNLAKCKLQINAGISCQRLPSLSYFIFFKDFSLTYPLLYSVEESYMLWQFHYCCH